MLAIGLAPLHAQVELTVSDGTAEDEHVPFYGFYLDNATQKVQTIYKADQLAIMMGASINNITFYSKENITKDFSKMNIAWSIGVTEENDLNAGFITNEINPIYEGQFINTENNKIIIPLSTPFKYTGGNLVIEFKKTNAESVYERIHFYGIDTSDKASRYSYGSSTNVAINFSPKTTFGYTPGELADYDMMVSPTNLSFPITVTGSEKTANLKVTNIGKNAISISASDVTAPFSIECPSEPIASLTSANLTVKFNPTAGGTFNQTPTITSSAGGLSQQLSLSGEGLALGDMQYKEEFNNLTTDNLLPKLWGCSSSSTADFSIYNKTDNKGISYTGSNSGTLLVSPYVKGNVIAFIKKTSNSSSASVKFFTCTQSGSTFTKGDEISAAISPDLNENDWSVAKLNVAEGTFIGIQLSYAAIDMFAAKEIVPVTSAAIIDMKIADDSKIVANTDGIAALSITCNIKNTGTTKIIGNTYTLTIKGYDGNIVGMLNGIDIEAGETKQITGSINYTPTIKANEDYEHTRFTASSDISTTTANSNWVYIYPYMGILSFRNETSSIISLPINLETFKSDRNATVYLQNSGTAPLAISSITPVVGINYMLTKEEQPINPPFTLNVDEKVKMIINIIEPGSYDGDVISIVHDGKGTTSSITMKATLITENTWFENFEKYNPGDTPSGWIIDNSNWNISERGTGSGTPPASTVYNKRCFANGNSNMSRAISPKVKIMEGELLTFSASGRTHYTSKVEILYSPDRITWTSAKIYSTNPGEGEETLPYPASYGNPVLQTYTVEIPTGEYYLGFDAGYAFIDDIYGYTLAPIDHDIYINSFNTDMSGMINYPVTATIKATNMLAKAETGGSYNIQLIEDDIVVSTITDDADWNGQKEFTLSYTPHKVGEHKLKAKITIDSYVTETAEVDITVKAETAEKEIIIGNFKNASGNTVPLTLGSKVSRSETVYTKQELANLSNGNIISKIAYPYYRSNSESPAPVKISIWLENTTDNMSVTNAPTFKDVANMTKYYEKDDYTFENGGSSSDLILAEFILNNDFIYSGDNIRIIIQAEAATAQYGYYFAYEKKTKSDTRNATTIYKSASDVTGLTNPSYFEDYTEEDWYEGIPESFVTKMPIIHFFSKQSVPAVSGTVKEKTSGAILAGAQVTLTAGDIIYNATANAEGVYSMDIFQANKSYNMTVNELGFADYAKTLDIAEVNLTENIELDFNAIEGAKVVGTNTIASLTNEPLLALVGQWNADKLAELSTKLGSSTAITGIYMNAINVPADAATTAFDAINPNALVYVKEDATVPAEWKNVVKGDKATEIVLKDGTAFAPAMSFNADKISYTRTDANAKETVCLPFAVSTIPDGYTVKSFDAHQGTKLAFAANESMEANVPYLIEQTAKASMSFEATDVAITAEQPGTVEKEGYKFTGTFAPIDNAAATYHVFNGTEFLSTIVSVAAFEGYFIGGGEGALTLDGAIGIDQVAENGMRIYSPAAGMILISTGETQSVNIYSVEGSLIRTTELNEGDNLINGLSQGIYLINNQKVVVR